MKKTGILLVDENVESLTNFEEKKRIFSLIFNKKIVLEFSSLLWSCIVQTEPELIVFQELAKCDGCDDV